MNVVVGSAFRNSGGRLWGYFSQVSELRRVLFNQGHGIRLIAVEGDSVDNTAQQLLRFADDYELPIRLVTRNHGGPVFGSTEAPERMKALSYVGNGILEAVRSVDDVLVYVESDLLWKADVIVRLMSLLSQQIDVISPLVMADKAFYDIWGFRKDGERFGPFHPYHAGLRLDQPTEVDSVGSCLVMKAQVARDVRIPDGGALVGFCQVAREQGYHVWVDARERINHP